MLWTIAGALRSTLTSLVLDIVLVVAFRTLLFLGSLYRLMMSWHRWKRLSLSRAWRWSSEPRYDRYVTSKGRMMRPVILFEIHFCLISICVFSSVTPQPRKEKGWPLAWPWGIFRVGGESLMYFTPMVLSRTSLICSTHFDSLSSPFPVLWNITWTRNLPLVISLCHLIS